MSQHSIAIQIAEALYQLPVAQIDVIPPRFDWRGTYRLHDAGGETWLLRLLRLPDAADAMTQTGRLLDWLEHQQYPAPRLRRTRHGQIVGRRDGWASLLLSYIDGAVLPMDSPDFALLGRSLAQLHSLPLPTTPSLPRSRCHPDMLRADTTRQLAHAEATVPAFVQRLVTALRQSIEPLLDAVPDPCLTHGDCWYNNAIKASQDRVVLIDWDCAGIGLPILDVGYLLLTAHYDLTRPVQVVADPAKIQALLRGYQQVRRIAAAERALLDSAVRFALAVHLCAYLQDHPHVTADDVVLQKMQARFAATEAISRLARAYLAEPP